MSQAVDNTTMPRRDIPKVIPIADHRLSAATIPSAGVETTRYEPAPGVLADQLGRELRDLRISVTDRCNFRCSYCMPKEVFGKDYPYLPQASLLTFEEITRIATQFVNFGVTKIRLTGGEPLLRKNIEDLISQLASLKTPFGRNLDITMTTNGALLARKARSLKDAGLGRITVSLDGLNDHVFKQMNNVEFPVAEVLAGIDAAQSVGLGPVKVNMVVKRGTNDHEILPMARHFRGTGAVLRFIEYMDVGVTNGWRMDEVLPSAEIVAQLQEELGLVALAPTNYGETAQRWGYTDAQGKHAADLGELGVISSVTQAFCKECSRARLSTEGKLYLCLFASKGYDLRELVRIHQGDEVLASAIRKIWHQRDDRYSELRAAQEADGAPNTPRVEMSYIGG
jgi:cyclic pyranopterin phosphate synthase